MRPEERRDSGQPAARDNDSPPTKVQKSGTERNTSSPSSVDEISWQYDNGASNDADARR